MSQVMYQRTYPLGGTKYGPTFARTVECTVDLRNVETTEDRDWADWIRIGGPQFLARAGAVRLGLGSVPERSEFKKPHFWARPK